MRCVVYLAWPQNRFTQARQSDSPPIGSRLHAHVHAMQRTSGGLAAQILSPFFSASSLNLNTWFFNTFFLVGFCVCSKMLNSRRQFGRRSWMTDGWKHVVNSRRSPLRSDLPKPERQITDSSEVWSSICFSPDLHTFLFQGLCMQQASETKKAE